MGNEVYWMWLSLLKDINEKNISSLIKHFKDVESVYYADSYEGVEGIGKEKAQALMNKDISIAEDVLEQTHRCGARVVTYESEEYPELMREVDDMPHVLYVKGKIPKECLNISVIGTRKYSVYGRNAAIRICGELAYAGCVVVSGLARGIDSIATQAALHRGGKVIGVLGCGIDVVYPRENAALMDFAAKHGAVITQFPPGTKPEGRNFPVRNKVIAALSSGTLVVEAPEKSGALITARYAVEYNRDLFAVPGSIFSANAVGSNRLIRNGAKLVGSGADVLFEFQAELEYLQKNAGNNERPAEETRYKRHEYEIEKGISAKADSSIDIESAFKESKINSIKRKLESLNGKPGENTINIVECLAGGELQWEQLAEMTGIETSKLMIELTELEMNGIVECGRGNFYKLVE